jgi:hypothetical protein
LGIGPEGANPFHFITFGCSFCPPVHPFVHTRLSVRSSVHASIYMSIRLYVRALSTPIFCPMDGQDVDQIARRTAKRPDGQIEDRQTDKQADEMRGFDHLLVQCPIFPLISTHLLIWGICPFEIKALPSPSKTPLTRNIRVPMMLCDLFLAEILDILPLVPFRREASSTLGISTAKNHGRMARGGHGLPKVS